jgi:hypothetical protein
MERMVRFTNGSVTTGFNADHITSWQYDASSHRLRIWITTADDASEFYGEDARMLLQWLKMGYVDLDQFRADRPDSNGA